MNAPVLDEAEIARAFAECRNWGRWGDDDELGTLNHISPEKRRQAATLVREGLVVSLAQEMSKR